MVKNKEDSIFEGFSDADNGFFVENASKQEQVHDVVSTGSSGLDDALFCGGLPSGRLIQYYGPAGSGKSMLTMVAIAQAQKKNPDAFQLFIDAEGSWDNDWAETIGVDTSRVKRVHGPNASNGRDLFQFLLGTPKKDAKGHLDGKSKMGFFDHVKDGTLNCNLIILDSLGVLIPPMEDTSEVGKMNMSLMARFLSVELKKVSVEVQRCNVPMILINHVRDVIGEMFSTEKYTFTGGHQLKHQLSVNILFEAVQRKDSQILDEEGNKIGQTVRATVKKNKFGPWPRTVEFKVNFQEGVVDKAQELLDLAIKWGIITKPSNSSYVYGDVNWHGAPKAVKAISETEGMEAELLAKITEARKASIEAKKTVRRS